MHKLIITAALTGAEVTREQQPALPISPEEVAQAAWECAQAGAAIVHIHARRPDGSSTQDAAAYRALIDAVRARCDVIVQVSTGGAVGMSSAERLGPVSLRPEMATLSMGSISFSNKSVLFFHFSNNQVGSFSFIKTFGSFITNTFQCLGQFFLNQCVACFPIVFFNQGCRSSAVFDKRFSRCV